MDFLRWLFSGIVLSASIVVAGVVGNGFAFMSQAEAGSGDAQFHMGIVNIERAYKLSRAEIAVALDGLLSATELDIEGSDEVAPALELYRNDGFGFADLMIVAAARRAGVAEMVTFDRKAARLPGARLLGK